MKRKLLTALCVLYVLFVVYNTLLPFRVDYGWHDVPARLQTINWHVSWRSPQRASLTDIGGNILLFVPLGFCLTYALLTPLRRCMSRTVMDVLRMPLLLYVALVCSRLSAPPCWN